jgi:DNA primase
MKQLRKISRCGLKQATDVMQWYFSRAFLNKDISNPKHKQEIATELLQEIQYIPYAVEQDHWMQELSGRLRTSVEVLRDNLKQIQREQKEFKTGKKVSEIQPTKIISEKKTRLDSLLEQVLGIILRFPALASESQFVVGSQALSTGMTKDLYEMLKKQYTEFKVVDIEALRAFCASEERTENPVDVLLMQAGKDFSELSEIDAKKELDTLISLTKDAYIKQERVRLQELIVEAEKNGDTAQLEHFMRELIELK